MGENTEIWNLQQLRKKELFGTRTKLSYNFFAENLLAIEMRKTQILTNKSVHLGLPISELSEIVMYSLIMIT